MVRANIGIVNALIRITCGLTLLSWATVKYCKKPWRESVLLLMAVGAMKVAEGILRFCPITFLFENYADLDFDDEDYDHEMVVEGETYNPS